LGVSVVAGVVVVGAAWKKSVEVGSAAGAAAAAALA
jgi:hypothetical protein